MLGSNYRSPRACTQCRSQKLKCDGHLPCQRCVDKQKPCVYGSGAGQRQTHLESTADTSHDQPTTGSALTRDQRPLTPIEPDASPSDISMSHDISQPSHSARLTEPMVYARPADPASGPSNAMFQTHDTGPQALPPWTPAQMDAVFPMTDDPFDMAIDLALWGNPAEVCYYSAVTRRARNLISIELLLVSAGCDWRVFLQRWSSPSGLLR